jgi:hypothetical protein
MGRGIGSDRYGPPGLAKKPAVHQTPGRGEPLPNPGNWQEPRLTASKCVWKLLHGPIARRASRPPALRSLTRCRQITVVIEHVLPANSDVNLFDVEMAFRDAARAAYVITGPIKTFHVITGGLPAMLAAVAAAGRSIEKNRAALAGTHRRRSA